MKIASATPTNTHAVNSNSDDKTAVPPLRTAQISLDAYFQVTGGKILHPDKLSDALCRHIGLIGMRNAGPNRRETELSRMHNNTFAENVDVATYHRETIEDIAFTYTREDNVTTLLAQLINEKINPIQNTIKSEAPEVLSVPVVRGAEVAFRHFHVAENNWDLKKIGLNIRQLKRDPEHQSSFFYIFLKGDLQKGIQTAEDLKQRCESLKKITTDIDKLGFITDVTVNGIPVLLTIGVQRQFLLYLFIKTGLTGTMAEDFDALRRIVPDLFKIEHGPSVTITYPERQNLKKLFNGNMFKEFQIEFDNFPQIAKNRTTVVNTLGGMAR